MEIDKSLLIGLSNFSMELMNQTEERKRLELQYESLKRHTAKLADHAINCQVKSINLDKTLQSTAKERDSLLRHLHK